jgi:hypothetical protein
MQKPYLKKYKMNMTRRKRRIKNIKMAKNRKSIGMTRIETSLQFLNKSKTRNTKVKNQIKSKRSLKMKKIEIEVRPQRHQEQTTEATKLQIPKEKK